MSHTVILDFDNTMGVPDCDVDDGLALLHLLGCDDVDVLGLCTSYGNSTIEIVHDNTLRMLNEWKLNLPVYQGAANPDKPVSDAARYLAEQVAARPGEITILATGSLTNLRGASLVSPSFFRDVHSVFIMGGIERSLIINGRIMNELNLTCDPLATEDLLRSGCSVTVATAQACLDAFFTRKDFAGAFGADSWLTRTCEPWFETMASWYDWNGFACWDVVAAAALTHPELFRTRELPVTLNKELLGLGYLERAEPDAPCAIVNAPVIADPQAFTQFVLRSWKRGLSRIDGDSSC